MKHLSKKVILCMLAVSLLLITFLFTGCSKDGNGKNTPKPTPPTISNVAFDTYNQFAIELLKMTREKGKNQIVSPISVGVALTMIHMGAGTDTAAGLEEALNMKFTDINTTTNSCHEVINRLTAYDHAWFNSDTALYIGEGASIREDMATRWEDYFKLMISFLDFSDSDSLVDMNDWVDRISWGRIDQTIFTTDSIDEDMTALMINLSTMDCRWETGFISDNTRSIPFESDDGRAVAAPTMRGRIQMKLYEGEDALAGFIPLSQDNTTMAIMMPPEDVKLSEFIDTLQAPSIQMWQSIAYEDEQWVLLPEFKLYKQNSLKDVLSQMGAQDVFIKESADFRPMGVNFYLDNIIQGVQIRADEDGENTIEVSSIDLTRAINNKEYFFAATRPFVYAVIDDETGGILMLGVLANPIEK